MINMIETDKLKEHHKNGYYFTDIEGEKYEEVKRSIQENGIRDPIKCTRDYTVISGHQRLRIARDLNMDKVPYQMLDVDEKEAEYLLIAENVERRGQAETDPIKKSRIANFLKEYWGVQQGSRSDLSQNGTSKGFKDISNIINESRTGTHRILKLNDLIPELQELVSQGKLGTTAGEQLAHMTEDNQRALLEVLGKEIEKTTVKKAKQYREEETKSKENNIDYKKQLELMKKQLEQAKQSEEIALRRLEEVQEKVPKTPKVIEKEVVKEVVPERVKQKILEIEKERDELDAALSQTYSRLRDLERLEKSVKHQEQSPLYDIYRTLISAEGYLQVFVEDERLSGNLVANADDDVISKVKGALSRVTKQAQQAKNIIENEHVTVIDIE